MIGTEGRESSKEAKHRKTIPHTHSHMEKLNKLFKLEKGVPGIEECVTREEVVSEEG